MSLGLTQFSLPARVAVLCLFVAASVNCDGSGTDVTVRVPVATVEVAPEIGTVEIGQTLQLTAIPRDANGEPLQRSVTWSSSDPASLSVDNRGLVTGVLEGTAVITATSEGVAGAATIRVIRPGAYDCSVQSEIPQVECWALVALYEATNGPGWSESTGWLANTTPCSWQGVICPPGYVSQLALRGNQLSGPIPSELGNLSNLEGLWLSDNQLTGPIPAELGNLSNRLWDLDLSSNDLTGPIPAEFGNLVRLGELSLSHNQLTGPIPPEFGSLTNLWYLNISHNQLTGPIPAEMGNMVNLEELDLFSNELTGAIPSSLGNLSNLTYLDLDFNQITGPIPAGLGNLLNLRYLYLGSSQLTGPIPPELGNLSNLVVLILSNAQLNGAIPAELGNLSNLYQLHLSNNQLTGPIPAEFGNLSSLWDLDLEENQLTGPIPTTLGILSNLERLNLRNNQLTGPIPPEIGNLAKLAWLDLSSNRLSDLIPLHVAQLGGLIQSVPGTFHYCRFAPPGNDGLFMPDTQEYQDADLDVDGLICGLGFTAVPASAVAKPDDRKVEGSFRLARRR